MINAAVFLALAAAAFLAASNNPLRSDDVLERLQPSEDRNPQGFPVSKVRFYNEATGMCLGASDVQVSTGICNAALIPMWELNQHLTSQSLRHIDTGKCLEMSLAGHGRVYLATCDLTNSQQRWDLSSRYIRNIQLNSCLNQKAQAAPCLPVTYMQWRTQKMPY